MGRVLQVWLHGIISSRFECSGIQEDVLTEHSAYIIGFDRPGYGASSPHIGRTYRTYVQVWGSPQHGRGSVPCHARTTSSHACIKRDRVIVWQAMLTPPSHCRVQDLKFALGVLGVGACYVVGVSGGGPYALAFAAFEPHTVKGLLLISPAGYPGVRVAAYFSWACLRDA